VEGAAGPMRRGFSSWRGWTRARGLKGAVVGKNQGSLMDTLAIVLIAVSTGLTVVLVVGAFIWGAVKDGEEDKAVQARLGIRRRTRLGR